MIYKITLKQQDIYKNYIDVLLTSNKDNIKFTFNLITQDFYNNNTSIWDYLDANSIFELMLKINNKYYN